MLFLLSSLAFADPVEEENEALREAVSALQEESEALREESGHLRDALQEKKSQVSNLRIVVEKKNETIQGLEDSLAEQAKKTINAELLAEDFESLYLKEAAKPKPVMPLERALWITTATALLGGTVYFYAKSTSDPLLVLD